MDNSVATRAAAEIHNIAMSKPMPERFTAIVRIVEKALQIALRKQREAMLKESRN